MTRVAVATLAFMVIWGVFTTVFAASANKPEVRLLPKWLWITLCAVVPFFGGLLYLMVGRPLRPQTRSFGGKGRVIAPDDDPNFLRDLSRRMNRDTKPPSPPKEPKDSEAEPDEDKKDGDK